MTSTDRNDLMPAQEKLEWVTPKISLMVAGETDGKQTIYPSEINYSDRFYLSAIPTAIPTKTSHPKGSANTPFFIEFRSFAALIIWHGCC
jgi:hypothetical protein